MTQTLTEEVRKTIRTIPDFPKKGIQFRDITPLLVDYAKFKKCIDHFASITKGKIDYVISIESRGFILGSALTYALGSGFVPIRKKGKLPYKTFQTSYELEYGTAVVEIHTDSIKKGSNIILIDDVLATGGTMKAAIDLAANFGVKIAGVYFLIELSDLNGRARLKGYPVHALVSY